MQYWWDKNWINIFLGISLILTFWTIGRVASTFSYETAVFLFIWASWFAVIKAEKRR
jgi:hypothetical protein